MAIVTSIGARISIPLAGLMQLSSNLAQPASPEQVARREKVMEDFKLRDPAGFEKRRADMERRLAANR
jgi:hypothetical protein